MANVKKVKEFLASISVEKYMTDEEIQNEFDNYYTTIYKTINFCKGCSNDINMALMRLQKEVGKQEDDAELNSNVVPTKYKFKKDVRLYSNSLKMMVTKHNLTDIIAEKLIAENGKHSDLFDIVEIPAPAITIQAFTEAPAKKKGRKKKIETITAL
jgi:hypothetical protein